DHSAHRSVEPTKATNPAAATTPTPRSWVSLAPWVPASRGAMAASRQAISRSRVSIVLNRAAKVAALPAVAAGWAGSAACARPISRAGRGRGGRHPGGANRPRGGGSVRALAGVAPWMAGQRRLRPADKSGGQGSGEPAPADSEQSAQRTDAGGGDAGRGPPRGEELGQQPSGLGGEQVAQHRRDPGGG